MTVGIGAACESFQNVILAADVRGSYSTPRLGPNDEMGKQFSLPLGLYADIAGYFSHCESLIAFLTHYMEELKKQPEVLLGHIRDAIWLAQAQELRFRFNTALRNNLGMDLEEWKKSTNARILRSGRALMRSTEVMVELIVGGFTPDSAVLLSTAYKDPPEIVSSHVTVGSGWKRALVALDKRKQNPHYSCQRTILHIAEALKAAKIERTVGPPADYIILQRGAVRRFKARDPFVSELITKYKGRDSAELDNDDDAREKIKSLMYEQNMFTP